MLSEEQIENIYRKVSLLFDRANESLDRTVEKRIAVNESALSNAIPGWDESFVKFGAYQKDVFAALFVDMRKSTDRALRIGAENTFLTMYAYLPAMLETVYIHNGSVVDIAGDGVMALWKEGQEIKYDNISQQAGVCGMDMLRIKDEVSNRLLMENNLEEIDIGIGVSFGEVVITKIGFPDRIYDVKAFGNCINEASHLSKGNNEVRVSKIVEEKWPSSIGGKITFALDTSGEYYVMGV